MSRFIETLAIRDGRPLLLNYHQRRLDRARRDFGLADRPLDLASTIRLPASLSRGLAKCTVEYGDAVHEVRYQAYRRRLIRAFRWMDITENIYPYKFADRRFFNDLSVRLTEGEEIIFTLNGYIADTTFTNIVLYDGADHWTPAVPLLDGVKRSFYLDQKMIKTAHIRADQIGDFQQICLINALNDLSDYALPINELTFSSAAL